MSLSTGTRLGPYEITGALGAGGMGEVYRGRDTRLDRTVAIKVLPSHLCSDANLQRRFDREARAISTFSHPNICHLYDVGHDADTDYLVMEYLEGETLAARLSRKGPLPIEQVVQIGIEIADALETAHRHCILHRDLKPGNIMLTKSGAKLMDFGLAKPTEAAVSTGATVDATMKPLTGEGKIVGTFQYMSPEQLQGKEADVRSDIFSLGVVLYEMATGKHAFEGKSPISVLAAILEKNPEPISKLQPMAPLALEFVVKTCLEKDPDNRPQSAHDVKLQLKWIAQSSAAAAPAGAAPWRIRGKWASLGLWVAAIVGTTAALILGLLYYAGATRGGPGIDFTRFTIPLPKGQELSSDSTLAVALSPDGRKLGYVAAENGISHLVLRSLDQFDSTAVPDSEGATFPFFSPDSQWVAFFSHGKLKKAPAVGGNPVDICEVPSFLGATWTSDDQIVLAIVGSGLATVPAAGGTPAKLNASKIPDADYSPARPVSLTNSPWVLFMNFAQTDQEILALNRASGEFHQVLNHVMGAQISRERLVYYMNGTIWAVPFDARKVAAAGTAVSVATNVNENLFVAEFAAARDTDILAYAPGGVVGSARSLYWVDRKGSMRRIDIPSQDYVDPNISPDGKHFSIANRRVNAQTLAVYDTERGVLMYVTARATGQGVDTGVDTSPVWTPDGKELVFGHREGVQKRGIYEVAADGSSPPELIRELPGIGHVTSVSQQGLASVMLTDPVTDKDLWFLDLRGGHEFRAFRRTPAAESQGSFSPDGKWLAYASNESGRSEIYVEPVPGPGGRWQISTNGGEQPRWSHDGREIFYREGTKMMDVVVQTRAGFSSAKPVELFDVKMDRGGAVPGYDVSPDGKMFLMVKTDQPNPTEIRMVLGWSKGLAENRPQQ